MNRTRKPCFLLFPLLIGASSCALHRQPLRVQVARLLDTVTVYVDPEAHEHWSRHDSLVILCESCDEGPRIVERFKDVTAVHFEVSRYDSLRFSIYGDEHHDSLLVIENV